MNTSRKTIVETLSRFMSLSMYYNTPTIEQNFAETFCPIFYFPSTSVTVIYKLLFSLSFWAICRFYKIFRFTYGSIVSGFSYMTYVIPFIVMNSFVPLITSISLETIMSVNTLLLIMDVAMIPLIWYFIKKYRPVDDSQNLSDNLIS